MCHPVGTLGAYCEAMDTPFVCPECGDAHDEPGAAVLGHRVLCLDCQIEIDLAAELAAMLPVGEAA